MKKRLNNKKGFTLIELIVVIAVIAILAAVLIPRFAGFTNDAHESAIRSSARNALMAMEALVAHGDIDNTTLDDDVQDAVDAYVGGTTLGAITNFVTDAAGIDFDIDVAGEGTAAVTNSNINGATITPDP